MDSRALRDLRGESEFPPASAPGGDTLIGTLVADRYRVVRKLGEGAQASVYVAKHTLIKRLVALKVLSPSIAHDRDLVRRFLDEGQVAGTMGHPNIVESLDMGVIDDGRPFLVLEYLEGTTVADELHRRRALDVGRAAYIGAQIASALSAAHARGIVHRDLKPENVFLIDRDGHGDHVKVLDFGISKLESRKEGGAHAGLVVGTPDYMAPEQVTDPLTVDARADVFALGAMLYEMLSGRLPLDAGADEDVLEVVVRRTPAPLGRICPHLPPGILATVERAMHKDRSKRTQTIAEVRAALEMFAVASAPSATTPLPVGMLPKAAGAQTWSDAPDSGPRSSVSGAPSRSSMVTPPPSASLAALATTNENPALHSEHPHSNRSVSIAAVSTASLASSSLAPASANPNLTAAATAASANADRLTAQLAAIAAETKPVTAGRSMTIPLFAGALGACAAGALVFFMLRGNTTAAQTAAAASKLEAPTNGAPRADGTATAGALAATANTALPGSMAGSMAAATAAETAARTAPSTPPKNAREAAALKAHEAATAAALSAAEARRERDKEKSDALANAAAEVSAHSTAAASLAAAAPPAAPAPEPAAPPPVAMAAPTSLKPTILPFGEGMTRPTSLSSDEIQFPREALEAKVAGTMIIRCLVNTDGSNSNCRIMKSVPMMDQVVLNSLAKHRGAPVTYQGKPVAVEYTYTIRLKTPD